MKTEMKSFPAVLDSLEPIRDFISEMCDTAHLDKKKCYAICLAIDEIATNIIRYGYGDTENPENKIDVFISTDDQRLQVILVDSAIEFNPLQHTAPNEEDLAKPLEERKIGGLGIMLAIENVDDFKYEFVDEKNRNIFIMVLV